MKNRIIGSWRWVLLVVALIGFSSDNGFAQEEKVRIALSVRPKTDKDKDKGSDEVVKGNTCTTTDFKTETEICTLEVKVKNGGTLPVSGQLEWCFVSDHSSGKTLQGKPEKAVPAGFNPGSKPITIPAGEEISDAIVSLPFLYEEKTVVTEITTSGKTTQRDTETGDAFQGYIVLVTVDGEVVASDSNSSRYLKDEWIEICRTSSKTPAVEEKPAVKKTNKKTTKNK
jgi:hypothetical protein